MTKSGFEIMKCLHFSLSLFRVVVLLRPHEKTTSVEETNEGLFSQQHVVITHGGFFFSPQCKIFNDFSPILFSEPRFE